MRPIGLFLILVGLVGITWGGVAYIKDRDAIHLGPIHLATVSRDRLSIPSVAGVGALVVGGLLVFVSTRRGMHLIS